MIGALVRRLERVEQGLRYRLCFFGYLNHIGARRLCRSFLQMIGAQAGEETEETRAEGPKRVEEEGRG